MATKWQLLTDTTEELAGDETTMAISPKKSQYANFFGFTKGLLKDGHESSTLSDDNVGHIVVD